MDVIRTNGQMAYREKVQFFLLTTFRDSKKDAIRVRCLLSKLAKLETGKRFSSNRPLHRERVR